jgi:SAM-dependent methyltransferase
MASMNSDRFEHFYKNKELFRQPYTEGTAKAIAGALEHYGQQSVKILVAGGGTGDFSRFALPRVKEILAEKGHYFDIDVLETDVSKSIKQAPGKSQIADITNLKFPENSYDFVIAESLIDLLEHRMAKRAFANVAKVLKPGGSFIHIQATLPSLNNYGKSILADYPNVLDLFEKSPHEDFKRTLAASIANQVHNNLYEQMRFSAKRASLSHSLVSMHETAILPIADYSALLSKLEFTGKNHISDLHGVRRAERDASLPLGKIQLVYKSPIAIFTKGEDSDKLAEYLLKRNYAHKIAEETL